MKKNITITENIRRSARVASVAIALTGIGVSMCATFAPQAAMAQDPNKKISLNFQNAPIQTVLKTLFNSQGINNTIDADVQGNVNININDVSFDVALRSLLRSASPPLTFDVQDGIYHIRVKTNNPTVVVPNNPAPSVDPGNSDVLTPRSTKVNLYKLPIDRYDAFLIAQLITSAKSIIVQVLPNYPAGGSGGQGGQQGGGGGQQGGGQQGGGGGGFGGGGGGGGF